MKTYTLQSPKTIAGRVVSKVLGGKGSGNYGHSGLDKVHGGSSKGKGAKFYSPNLDKAFSTTLNPSLKPEHASTYFKNKLKGSFNGKSIDIYHETPIKNLDSIKKSGFEDGESVFGTVGEPSKFVSGKKAIIRISVPKSEIDTVSPDMRYNPDNPHWDLLKQHKGVLGADVSISSVSKSWITEIKIENE